MRFRAGFLIIAASFILHTSAWATGLLLVKSGWTIKDRHDPEFRNWDTIEVQNEHFSVSQQFLETG